MALKGDRYEALTDVSYHMDEVQERGLIVVYSTVGSGAALDQSQALVTVAADPSGLRAVGVLMNDMVNKDLTRTHINFHKDEMQKGGKVAILRTGFVVTDQITGSPTAGAKAYVGANGVITPTSLGSEATPLIGEFMSTADEDGYAKVWVNLP